MLTTTTTLHMHKAYYRIIKQIQLFVLEKIFL